MFTLGTLLLGGAVTELGRYLFNNSILPIFQSPAKSTEPEKVVEEAKLSVPQPAWKRSALGGYTTNLFYD